MRIYRADGREVNPAKVALSRPVWRYGAKATHHAPDGWAWIISSMHEAGDDPWTPATHVLLWVQEDGRRPMWEAVPHREWDRACRAQAEADEAAARMSALADDCRTLPAEFAADQAELDAAIARAQAGGWAHESPMVGMGVWALAACERAVLAGDMPHAARIAALCPRRRGYQPGSKGVAKQIAERIAAPILAAVPECERFTNRRILVSSEGWRGQEHMEAETEKVATLAWVEANAKAKTMRERVLAALGE